MFPHTSSSILLTPITNLILSIY